MSLNPGMEQDFRDMIRKFNSLTILARRGVVEAIEGEREGISITLSEMRTLVDGLDDTVQVLGDTLDTFTERPKK